MRLAASLALAASLFSGLCSADAPPFERAKAALLARVESVKPALTRMSALAAEFCEISEQAKALAAQERLEVLDARFARLLERASTERAGDVGFECERGRAILRIDIGPLPALSDALSSTLTRAAGEPGAAPKLFDGRILAQTAAPVVRRSGDGRVPSPEQELAACLAAARQAGAPAERCRGPRPRVLRIGAATVSGKDREKILDEFTKFMQRRVVFHSSREVFTPLEEEKHRVGAALGLAPYVRMFAPELEDEYIGLIGQILPAVDEASVRALEEKLDGLKGRMLERAREFVKAQKGPEKLLEALRAKAGAGDGVSQLLSPFEGLSMPGPRRIVVEREMTFGDWWNRRWGMYVEWQLPIEAELLLGTKFPVMVTNQYQRRVLVIPGEQFGTSLEAEAAERELKARQRAAADAARGAADARQALELARGAVDAADAQRKAAEEEAKAALERAAQARRQAQEAEELAAAARRDAEWARQEAASADRILQDLLTKAEGIDLNIEFELGSSELTLPEAKEQVAQLGKALVELRKRLLADPQRNIQEVEVYLNGHTDAKEFPKGSDDTNLKLSQRRAEAVRKQLVENFRLPFDSLIPVGFGASQLLPKFDKLDKRQRRVQVKLKRDSAAAAALAELEAKAAAEQAALQRAAAEKAKTSVRAAEAAERALRDRLKAVTQLDHAVGAAEAADAALAKSREDREAAERKLPAAERAKIDAAEAAKEAAKIEAEKRDKKAGLLIVQPFADHHTILNPEKLHQRLVETMLEKFRGWDNGRDANKILSGVNVETGARLVDEVARDIIEHEKTGWTAAWETFKDIDRLLPFKRYIDVFGRRGRQWRWEAHDGVVDVAKEDRPQPPIETTIVTSAELEALRERNKPKTGPIVRKEGEPKADPLPREVPRPLPPAAGESVLADAREELKKAAESTSRLKEALTQAEKFAEEAAERAKGAGRRAALARKRADERGGEEPQSAAELSGPAGLGESRRVYLEVYFDYDKSDIKPEYYPELAKLARVIAMPKYRGWRFAIYGNTDGTGQERYNEALSLRRANAIIQHMLQLGFPAERFVPFALGKRNLKPGIPPDDWRNRRAEVGLVR